MQLLMKGDVDKVFFHKTINLQQNIKTDIPHYGGWKLVERGGGTLKGNFFITSQTFSAILTPCLSTLVVIHGERRQGAVGRSVRGPFMLEQELEKLEAPFTQDEIKEAV